MEAKDTVMSDEQIRATCLGKGLYWVGEMGEKTASDAPPILLIQFRRVAQAQAKYSFPAGEKQGYDKGFKAGIEDMAECLQRAYILPLTKQAGLIQVRNLEADLKAKRKEVGL